VRATCCQVGGRTAREWQETPDNEKRTLITRNSRKTEEARGWQRTYELNTEHGWLQACKRRFVGGQRRKRATDSNRKHRWVNLAKDQWFPGTLRHFLEVRPNEREKRRNTTKVASEKSQGRFKDKKLTKYSTVSIALLSIPNPCCVSCQQTASALLLLRRGKRSSDKEARAFWPLKHKYATNTKICRWINGQNQSFPVAQWLGFFGSTLEKGLCISQRENLRDNVGSGSFGERTKSRERIRREAPVQSSKVGANVLWRLSQKRKTCPFCSICANATWLLEWTESNLTFCSASPPTPQASARHQSSPQESLNFQTATKLCERLNTTWTASGTRIASLTKAIILPIFFSKNKRLFRIIANHNMFTYNMARCFDMVDGNKKIQFSLCGNKTHHLPSGPVCMQTTNPSLSNIREDLKRFDSCKAHLKASFQNTVTTTNKSIALLR